jgi:hypothetical protein
VRALIAIAAIAALSASAVIAVAATNGGPTVDYTAYRASRSFKGRFPTSLVTPPAPNAAARLPAVWSNGGTADLSFSQDNRKVRLLAFDSSASNLVPDDRNELRDVFVLRRALGGGSLWGSLALVSVSSSGEQANGLSDEPSVDGATRSAPHCIAFDSEATNLSADDPAPDRDVYLRDLKTGRTRLLSRGFTGAIHPVIDGACRSIVFEARGAIWVASVASGRIDRLSTGHDPDQQTNGEGAAYVRTGQVLYRSFQLTRSGLRRSRERLVSSDPRGRPGNGESSQPAVDDRGWYVAFTSTATNLCRDECQLRDTNGRTADVFRRTLSSQAPTHDRMEIVSQVPGGPTQPGPSGDAVISAAGENVIFDSVAIMSRHGPGADHFHPNGTAASVYTWTYPRVRGRGDLSLVSPRPMCDPGCLSAEHAPAMSSRGNYVAYLARMSEFCVTDRERFPGDRADCPQFDDAFIVFMGKSHEGFALG